MQQDQLWEQLSLKINQCPHPIFFVGDFNEVVNPEEHSSGTVLTRGMREFGNWIDIGSFKM